MRRIERSSVFKHDYKRESKGQYRQSLDKELKLILEVLIQDQPIDFRYKDHLLIGQWQGYRECHIKPDLLLIYKKLGSDILQLARLGSHSLLFK